jgi:hypothetical protein
MGPTADLDYVEKGKTLHCRESNSEPSVIGSKIWFPVAQHNILAHNILGFEGHCPLVCSLEDMYQHFGGIFSASIFYPEDGVSRSSNVLYLSTQLHGITFQKIAVFIVAAEKPSSHKFQAAHDKVLFLS